MTTRTIGCAIGGLVYEIENKGSPDFLRNHPGYAKSILHGASDEILAEYEAGDPLCESPIEREMLAALLASRWQSFGIESPRIWNVNDQSAGRPAWPVVIMPQFQIGRHRLDFAISLPKKPIGTIIAVECDGSEYHDQALDRERNVQLGCFGVLTSRHSGSDIKRDPMACAQRVIQLCAEWANV